MAHGKKLRKMVKATLCCLFFGGKMKKIFKIMSYIFVVGVMLAISITDVMAAKVTIKLDYQSNVYYTRKGAGFNESHQYLYYSLNGVPAFCIEPGVAINDWDYITGDISKSPFNDEITNIPVYEPCHSSQISFVLIRLAKRSLLYFNKYANR